MNPTFLYSLDRETWTGAFPNRQAAVAEGIRAARHHPDSISTVYVGQKVVPSPRAYGHARQVIDTMRRRVREDNGDMADDFLSDLTEQQVMNLDGVLEQAIVSWLERHELLSPSFYNVEAISEHPVPVATFHVHRSPAAAEREVSELGESQWS